MWSELVPVPKRTLTKAQYSDLADVPPEIEWLANLTNAKTRRAYLLDVAEFSAFSGLTESSQLRTVTRVHVIAWRKDKFTLNPSEIETRRGEWLLIAPIADVSVLETTSGPA
jgi:hypothetical protein